MTNSMKTPGIASLPKAPNIPVSNASYAKIIAKVQQAAKHGPDAVAHVRDCVGGVNTYAKMVRRYADQCIAVLNGAPAPGDILAAQAKALEETIKAVPTIHPAHAIPAGEAAANHPDHGKAAKPLAKMVGTAKPKRTAKPKQAAA